MKTNLKAMVLGALALMLLGTGTALAGPDYAPITFSGWDGPIVPSDVANNDLDSATFPASGVLLGNQEIYLSYSWANQGDTTADQDFLSRFNFDNYTNNLWTSHTLSGNGNGVTNYPAVIRGGRHTLWYELDHDDTVAEDDETNNFYAQQFVWQPPLLPHNSGLIVASPPNRDAGREHIPAGGDSFDNIDAWRVSGEGAGYWVATAAGCPEIGNDYDLRLYTPSTGFQDGLDNSYLALSQRGGNLTDGVLVNLNRSPLGAWDVGTLNYSGTEEQYILDCRTSSVAWNLGDQVEGSFTGSQLIAVEELIIQPNELGSISLVLDMSSDSQPYTMALYDPDFTEGDLLNTALAVTQTDDTGRAILTVDVITHGYYGITIFRNLSEGFGDCDYTLQIRQTPADIVAYTIPGAHGPVLPYTTLQGGYLDPQPAPTSLPGDVFETNLYHSTANTGILPTGPFSISLEVDGVILHTYQRDELLPGFSAGYGVGAFRIPGGVHTLGVRNDADDALDEIFEHNNNHAEQWVWMPQQLEPSTSIVREGPPDPFGSHELIPTGLFRTENMDAFRSQTFMSDGEDGYWGAVAIQVEDEDADFDLSIFEPTQGARNGFDNLLYSSVFSSPTAEFVLLNFNANMAHGLAVDAGVQHWAGGGNYMAQSTSSTFVGPLEEPGMDFGTVELAADEILEIYEFEVPEASLDKEFNIVLEHVAGNLNLDLYVFKGDQEPFKNSFDSYAFANGSGPGQDVELLVTFDEAEYYSLVVCKRGSGTFQQAGQFALGIQEQSLSAAPDEMAGLPRVTGISSVYPNPFNPQTTVNFAMAQAGPAAVRIYDLQGRLVKTLVDGPLEAGNHQLVWQGRDMTGRAMPSGVYFVRAVHADGTDSQRISLVK